eukprot:GILJ01002692.1.p1 GENE.GILJ01002692.1~~GILJ01002692.1.p1  ORF type:complete len:487 (-),score=42.30 GILJ01002692.1:238-1698(-)
MTSPRKPRHAAFRTYFANYILSMQPFSSFKISDFCETFCKQGNFGFPLAKNDNDALEYCALNLFRKHKKLFTVKKRKVFPSKEAGSTPLPHNPKRKNRDDIDSSSSLDDLPFSLLFILPSPKERTADGFPDILRERMHKLGVDCKKITVEALYLEKNRDLLSNLQRTLVLVHCDAFIELVCSSREHYRPQGKNKESKQASIIDHEAVICQLKTLDNNGRVYPSLHMLRQTQDKLEYMKLMKSCGVQTASTWLPDKTNKYCFFTSNIGPTQAVLTRFANTHKKTGFVIKGSPSGYSDSVCIVRPTENTSIRKSNAFLDELMLVGKKDVFLQVLVDDCGYEIRTFWRGRELRFVFATRFVDHSMEIIETVFIHERGNFDALTGEQRTDLPFSWVDISNVVGIGETILENIHAQEWDFTRLDFLYVKKGRNPCLLLSDMDSLGCFCGHNVEYDIREGDSPIQDVVDCLQMKLRVLTIRDTQGAKRVKFA